MVRSDGPTARVRAGQTFHVPAGVPAHSFHAEGRLSAAGFAPLPTGPIDHGAIRDAGFELELASGEAVPADPAAVAGLRRPSLPVARS